MRGKVGLIDFPALLVYTENRLHPASIPPPHCSKEPEMDYRHYDHGRPFLPPVIRRNVRYFRPVGIVLCIVGVLIPFLMVVRALQSTYFLNFISYIFMFLGPCLYLIGLAFDGYVDR